MPKIFSITEFALLLPALATEIHKAKREALEAGAEIIEKEAKRVIGTYDYDWPPLAPTTQASRAQQGFPADKPLLRTGDLRDSIGHYVIDDNSAEIGSNSDVAVYQELGTSTIPPRPFLSSAAIRKVEEVERALGRATVKAFSGDKVKAQDLIGDK